VWVEADVGSCWWWSSGHSADDVQLDELPLTLFSQPLSLALSLSFALSSTV
jgi:hypothetical protein